MVYFKAQIMRLIFNDIVFWMISCSWKAKCSWVIVNQKKKTITNIFTRRIFNMYRPHWKTENPNFKSLSCGLQCHKIFKIIQHIKTSNIWMHWKCERTLHKHVTDCKTRKLKTQQRMPNKYCTASTTWYKPCLQASNVFDFYQAHLDICVKTVTIKNSVV